MSMADCENDVCCPVGKQCCAQARTTNDFKPRQVKQIDVDTFLKKTGGKYHGACPGVPEALNNKEHPPVTITIHKKRKNQFKIVCKNHSNNHKSAALVY